MLLTRQIVFARSSLAHAYCTHNATKPYSEYPPLLPKLR
jgi:hypothetical protein